MTTDSQRNSRTIRDESNEEARPGAAAAASGPADAWLGAVLVAGGVLTPARLDELYRPERAIERLLGGLEPARVEAVESEPLPAMHEPELAAPVAKLVDAMISDAVREGASDIHAEPTEGGVVVRYRVDGVLR